MTNRTKFGILDDDFLPALLNKCKRSWEPGLIVILYFTGMHLVSVTRLSMKNLITQPGPKYYIQWSRPKTNKVLQARIPEAHIPSVREYLEHRQVSPQRINQVLNEIGRKAGYPGVSTMTFRHSRCLRLLKERRSIPEVMQIMGASDDVIFRHYAKLRDDQIMDDMEAENGRTGNI